MITTRHEWDIKITAYADSLPDNTKGLLMQALKSAFKAAIGLDPMWTSIEMDRKIPDTREQFEERVFNRYFMSRVGKDLSFNGVAMKNKDELCHRDADDDYSDPSVSAMWFGWNLHADRELKYGETK